MALNRIGLAAAALAALVFSAGADTPNEVCAKTACRDGGFKLAVFLDKDRYTTIEVTHSPYVMDGSILIFPGETLVFELPLEGDKIGTPKFLGAYEPTFSMLRDPEGPPAPPSALPKLDTAKITSNTLVLSYGQSSGQGKDKPSMMMTLSQYTAKTVKLDAFMTVIQPHATEYKQVYTSTCPLMPKLNSYEMWPNPLGPMILSNFRVLPNSTAITCD